MRNNPSKTRLCRGTSLVEIMVSIGVLAVVAPLALAALLRAGEGGTSSRAETRAPLIVENCLAEVKMARQGISEFLPPLQAGAEFGDGEMLCLAFRADGRLLGRVDSGGYDAGIGQVANEDAVFLAKMEGVNDESRTGFPPMLRVKVTVEHPAVARAQKRRPMEFYTKLP